MLHSQVVGFDAILAENISTGFHRETFAAVDLFISAGVVGLGWLTTGKAMLDTYNLVGNLLFIIDRFHVIVFIELVVCLDPFQRGPHGKRHQKKKNHPTRYLP